MFTLVVGGSASGKSAYAESLVLQSERLPRYYIAAMQPFDDECRARIARHRKMRADKQFQTIERYTGLSGLVLPERGDVLLECLGNLAANELYDPAGAGIHALEAIVDGIDALLPQCGDLVVVSNEVCADGGGYSEETEAYRRLLAGANRALAERADRVCEVVCALSYYYKDRGRGI